MFDSLAQEIHEWARGKGFYDREYLRKAPGQFPNSVERGAVINESLPSEKLMLVVIEVSEVMEARRDGDEELEETEVADAIIRLLDYSAWRGFSMDAAITAKMDKNRERPRLHGRVF